MALPLPKIFWPVILTSSNNKLHVTSAGYTATYTTTIAAKTYYSAASLATAVQTALAAALAYIRLSG